MFWKKKERFPKELLNVTIEELEEKIKTIEHLVEDGYVLNEDQRLIVQALKKAIEDSKK